MPTFRCPGQDKRFWKPDDIFDSPCPHCGAVIEFWKDEPQLKCKGCGRTIRNPKIDLGCAEWCRYASECLPHIAPHGVEGSLCDAVIKEMKQVFGDDERRIRHALDVLEHAEELLEIEGGEPLVVKAAALLHDIGIKHAEQTHGSSAPKYQEIEGPPLARIILEKLAVGADQIDHICRIVGSHHSGGDIDTPEFRIIWDADLLVNSLEERAGRSVEELRRFVESSFRTEAGRSLAAKKLLSGDAAGRVAH